MPRIVTHIWADENETKTLCGLTPGPTCAVVATHRPVDADCKRCHASNDAEGRRQGYIA